MNTFNGALLKSLRENKNWRKEELAAMAKCALQTIHNAENGKMPQAPLIFRFARIFGVPMEDFLAENMNECPPDNSEAARQASSSAPEDISGRANANPSHTGKELTS